MYRKIFGVEIMVGYQVNNVRWYGLGFAIGQHSIFIGSFLATTYNIIVNQLINEAIREREKNEITCH